MKRQIKESEIIGQSTGKGMRKKRIEEYMKMHRKKHIKTHIARQIFPLCLCLLAVAGFLMSAGVQAEESLADSEYAIEVSMTGGSGKASIETPTLLTVEDGQCYARITWSSSNYDYMLVDEEKFLNQSEEGANSSFVIPVSALDTDITVIADTLAMGTPHEIEYVMHFYSDTLDSKSSLPQEAAKRVLAMAAVIIVGGGILNYWVKKRAQRDYTGKR
ncbi:MAG: hypothetical protein LIO94_12285 [Clostridiales bacterium]|nr:hypothetical protein [Clostridiales bacterium]